MRRYVCALAAVMLVGFSLPADAQTFTTKSTSKQSMVSGAPAGVPVRNAAGAMLGKRVESIDWVEKTVEEVIEWLKDQGQGRVNVVPRWNALQIENVDRDAFVTLQLNNTTVAEVLNETLEYLSGEGESELRFRAIGNTLRISTKADFERKLHVRVYNVTDILFLSPDFKQLFPSIDIAKQNQGGGGGGGGGGGAGQSIFQSSGGGGGGNQLTQQGGQEGQGLEEQLETLADLIVRVIAPDSWEDTSGLGTLATYDHSNNYFLVVRNTIEVHEMIAGAFVLGQ